MNLQSNDTRANLPDEEHRGTLLLLAVGSLDEVNDCNHESNHGNPNKCLQCQAKIADAMYHLLKLSCATRDGKLFFREKNR